MVASWDNSEMMVSSLGRSICGFVVGAVVSLFGATVPDCGATLALARFGVGLKESEGRLIGLALTTGCFLLEGTSDDGVEEWTAGTAD